MGNYKHNKAWRKRNPDIWQKGKQRYYQQFEAGAYNGKQRWPISDGNLVLQKNTSDRDLARILGRTVKAIQMYRVKLRKNFKNEKIIV